MKKTALALASVALLGGAFLAGAWFAHRASPAGGASARKVLYWVDPMHPAYRSDRAGIAPDCGMQLEPVYEDGATPAGDGPPRAAGAVTLPAGQQQLLGVKVAAVERTRAAQAVRLYGRVAAQETRTFTVNAALEGAVREVSAASTGSRVRRDQWLATVFAAEARAPLQAYITALDVMDRDPAMRREAGVVVAAGTTASSSALYTVERLRAIGVSQRQIDEIRRTRHIPNTLEVLSPVDGIVLERNVSAGQKFDKGFTWFRIANLDRVWVVADVFENEAPLVRAGMAARVLVPQQGRALTAKVAEVLPQFDPATRTLKVRLDVENPGLLLRPEMFVDVEVSVELPEATAIPVDALVDSGLRKTVFVERAPGEFEPRAVETGWRFGDRVEVTRGLAPGDRIVVSGTFLVDSESRLRAAANGVYGAAAKDPVCGMEVDEAKARAGGKVVHRGGHDVFFCSDACKARFEKAPERFEAAASPAPAKPAL
ncbi:MAG TPA: efflux RND transporter periplasmic adaptor subunit [Anaeromyxobacteraceae bacterium]|nr:efflux RND transporter periplasmic adaptor subunit [Anaeromyxobacteraceae bacterium]